VFSDDILIKNGTIKNLTVENFTGPITNFVYDNIINQKIALMLELTTNDLLPFQVQNGYYCLLIKFDQLGYDVEIRYFLVIENKLYNLKKINTGSGRIKKFKLVRGTSIEDKKNKNLPKDKLRITFSETENIYLKLFKITNLELLFITGFFEMKHKSFIQKFVQQIFT
jgi:hypothetical protein